ncbi:hypothetical protein AVEN_147712-1 [Araneus ventricosus]|uniref:Uncharacterized protein n=1 Tax=Araneus ventricosus TaxID=182803 RepID=A0A4Y1ZPA2_ARAVE|nr:hypothetical protein AVEN_147712-1 [Araneus ventricosus]
MFCNRGVKFVITSQQTRFANGLADYALLLCRKFAAKLPHQVCHDKLISRKIKLAASVHAIWGSVRRFSRTAFKPARSNLQTQVYSKFFQRSPFLVWHRLIVDYLKAGGSSLLLF